MPISSEQRTAPGFPVSGIALVLPVLLAACAALDGTPAPTLPAEPVTEEATEPLAPAIAETAAAHGAPDVPVAAASPAAVWLDDPEAITAGRRMFRAVCTGYCHSTTPGVTKDAPNLFDCDWDHGSADADLYRVITQGVPDTEMLPFDGKIPEDTIWKVIAYVRSSSLDCG